MVALHTFAIGELPIVGFVEATTDPFATSSSFSNGAIEAASASSSTGREPSRVIPLIHGWPATLRRTKGPFVTTVIPDRTALTQSPYVREFSAGVRVRTPPKVIRLLSFPLPPTRGNCTPAFNQRYQRGKKEELRSWASISIASILPRTALTSASPPGSPASVR